jgi:hypothetical protein
MRAVGANPDGDNGWRWQVGWADCRARSRQIERLGAEHRQYLHRGGSAGNRALGLHRTNLGYPAHARLGWDHLRGDPCKQGQKGEENAVHCRSI